MTVADVTQSNRDDNHLQYLSTLVPPSHAEFEKISVAQKQREREHRRRSKTYWSRTLGHAKTRKLSEASRTSSSGAPPMVADTNNDPASPENDAAKLIQRTYRGYRTRRELAGFGLSASTRWVTAVKDAQWNELTRPMGELGPAADGHRPLTSASRKSESAGAAKGHWRKATAVVRRAGNDIDASSVFSSSSSSSSSSSGGDEEAKAARRKRREKERSEGEKMSRVMALQYFLEMVDHKHRYGTNLTAYHEVWKSSDSRDNFFQWLDHGDGKHIDIASCPRDRLERERVRYLSVEERQYYLVEVDSEGRLCWAKNGERINTTTDYRDSMVGIVPRDDPAPSFRPETPPEDGGVPGHESDTDSSANSTAEADRAAKYSTLEFDKAKGAKKLSHLSAATITNRLLRKTVRKNTWIFVSDTRFRLYVGIKDSGSFQHSSFLQGSRIASAGLISITDGKLRGLSPLSGHYRPPAANFRAFVKRLKEAGVDMSRVSISKSYMILTGLEMYTKGMKASKSAVRKLVGRRERDVGAEAAAAAVAKKIEAEAAAAVKKKDEDEYEDVERIKSEGAKRDQEVLAAAREMAGLEVAEKGSTAQCV